jgi:hypothetical protein
MKTLNEQINPVLVSQAQKLTKITQFLRKVLPVECYKHVQVANIRQQVLMLITDSPVWTTRLRQLSPQILQYITENRQQFEACLNIHGQNSSHISEATNKQPIHHIQISTRYHNQHSNENPAFAKKHSHNLKISKKSSELLSQSANAITHPQLKTALLKLAQNTGQNS